MNHKEIVRDIKGAMGGLLVNAEFSERDGFLWLNGLPKMAMGALERIIRPLGVFIVRDRDNEVDVIINDGSARDIISQYEL